MIFNVMISNVAYKSKPTTKTEWQTISNSFQETEMNFEQFSEAVLTRSWSPTVYKNARRVDNFQKANMLALDIDSGISSNEVISILERHNIHANIVYQTLSSTKEQERFRICVILDTAITNVIEYKRLTRSLNALIGGFGDKKCIEPARFYLKGAEITHKDTTINKLSDVVEVLNCVTIAVDFGKKRQLVTKYASNDVAKNTKKILAFDYQEAVNKIQILNDFVSGVWLYHVELFGLATNLVHISGGMSWMRQVMQKHNELGNTFYTENNFAILDYVKYRNYNPQGLKEFSKHSQDWAYTNILTAITKSRGYVDTTNFKDVRIPLEVAEYQSNLYTDTFLNNPVIGQIKLNLAATGVGKTQHIVDYIKSNPNTSLLVAFETHDLKDEFAKKLKDLGVEFKSTPRIPIELSQKAVTQLEYYFANGYSEAGLQFLRSLRNGKIESHEGVQQDVLLIQKYFEDTLECYDYDGIVLTTHTRAANGNFKADRYIFDECPMANIARMSVFQISNLISYKSPFYPFIISEEPRDEKGNIIPTYIYPVEVREVYNKVIKKISKIRNFLLDDVEIRKVYDVSEVNDLNEDDIKLIKETIKSGHLQTNILEFLSSKSFVKSIHDDNRIHFVKDVGLRTDKAILILSATAAPAMYSMKFKERFDFFDTSFVETVGEQIQICDLSLSKSSLDNALKNKSEQLKALIGDRKVITHKNLKNKFDNSTEFHFGKASGSNVLEGQDIAVIGTQHLPEHTYFLIASWCGYHFNQEDHKLKMRDCEWNGIKFRFMTYENEILRAIQFSLIEAQLLQACGRSRIARFDCAILLLSNLPTRQSHRFLTQMI